jgi:hypothetical protein
MEKNIALKFLAFFGLLFIVACRGNTQNVPATTVIVDSTLRQTANAVIDSTVDEKIESAADMTGYKEDTSFINNGAKFIVWEKEDEDKENSDKYFSNFLYFVERVKNNRRDTILKFSTKWGYHLKDRDEDGYSDITIGENLNKYWNSSACYLFNSVDNNFGKEFYSISSWGKIDKGLFFDSSFSRWEEYKYSNLFAVEQGEVKICGSIRLDMRVNEEATTNDADKNKAPKLPIATLSKLKKGQENDEFEWKEVINPDLVKKYFIGGEMKSWDFYKEVWQKNYKRFQ